MASAAMPDIFIRSSSTAGSDARFGPRYAAHGNPPERRPSALRAERGASATRRAIDGPPNRHPTRFQRPNDIPIATTIAAATPADHALRCSSRILLGRFSSAHGGRRQRIVGFPTEVDFFLGVGNYVRQLGAVD